jgi:hypothetical protein
MSEEERVAARDALAAHRAPVAGESVRALCAEPVPALEDRERLELTHVLRSISEFGS